MLSLHSTKDPGQKPFTFQAGVGQVIAGDAALFMAEELF